MSKDKRTDRLTFGVLAGWQFYRTATNLSYLAPLFRGICQAGKDLQFNVLLGCGIGPSASPSDPLRPAWPFVSPEHDYVPISPGNTDGLIIAAPLHSQARSDYVKEVRELSEKHCIGLPVLIISLIYQPSLFKAS